MRRALLAALVLACDGTPTDAVRALDVLVVVDDSAGVQERQQEAIRAAIRS